MSAEALLPGNVTEAVERVMLVLSILTVILNCYIERREYLRRDALLADNRHGTAKMTARTMIGMGWWRGAICAVLVSVSIHFLYLPNSDRGAADSLKWQVLLVIVLMFGKSIYDAWSGIRLHEMHDREHSGEVVHA